MLSSLMSESLSHASSLPTTTSPVFLQSIPPRLLLRLTRREHVSSVRRFVFMRRDEAGRTEQNNRFHVLKSVTLPSRQKITFPNGPQRQ